MGLPTPQSQGRKGQPVLTIHTGGFVLPRAKLCQSLFHENQNLPSIVKVLGKALTWKNDLKKRRILTWENCVVFGGCFGFGFFWDNLISPGWPWIDYAAKDDLKLLTFLPLPFKCYNYKGVPATTDLCRTGGQTYDFEHTRKVPANWAIPPAQDTLVLT